MGYIDESVYTSQSSIKIVCEGITHLRCHVFVTNFDNYGNVNGWLCVYSSTAGSSLTITRGTDSRYPKARTVEMYETDSATVHVAGRVYSDSELPPGYQDSSTILRWGAEPHIEWAESASKGTQIGKSVTAEKWNDIKVGINRICYAEGRQRAPWNTVSKGDTITAEEFNLVRGGILDMAHSIITNVPTVSPGQQITADLFNKLLNSYNDCVDYFNANY